MEKKEPIIDECGRCYDEARGITIYDCKLSDDLSYISGYSDEGKKARYVFERGDWLYGSDIGRANMRPLNTLPKAEALAIQKKGAEKIRKTTQEKQTLNDIAKNMLDVEISEGNIDEILGKARELLGDQKSAGAVMIAKMIQTAYAGSFKAAEFVRDTAGYKPAAKNELDISADIITAEDRSLIDKLNKRLTG